ncbi:putative non-specific serine/threonine protein kinase [Helianthus annuus]|nr:putative non-specific serine/threonine protein kinase [Helianthus annuus]
MRKKMVALYHQWMVIPYMYSCLFLLSILLPECAALDTVYANQPITDGKTIVSKGKMFELGFFSPGKSKNRYLGIWYQNISVCTVVWVANRETPITDRSGMFKVSNYGNMEILNGSNTMVWSSKPMASGRSNNPMMVMMQLLDSGNLVVSERDNNRTNKNLIWQSYDHPGDTILPGMKFGKDLITGFQRFVTSWKSPDDPSIGLYSNIMDINGYPQIFGLQDQVLILRLGPWNGLSFSGFPIDKANPIYSSKFVFNEKEIYHKYELISSAVQRQRVVLTWDGRTRIFHWIERIQDWIVYGDLNVDNCDHFAVCGPYGSCSIHKHPPCTCMPGFEPRNPREWDASDWSSGCKRKTPLNCGNVNADGFRKITRVKLPDTRKSWYNVSMTLGECEMACRMKCNCTAYANLDISNGGSGCLLWFDELLDIRNYDEDHNIYIRMAASELAGHQSDSNKNESVVIWVLSFSSAAVFLCVVAYAYKKNTKRLQMKDQGDMEYALDKKNTDVQTQFLGDIPFISLYKVAKATNNFSVSNKIGEGGFGLLG